MTMKMVGSEMDGSTKTLKFISAAVYEINSSVQHSHKQNFSNFNDVTQEAST